MVTQLTLSQFLTQHCTSTGHPRANVEGVLSGSVYRITQIRAGERRYVVHLETGECRTVGGAKLVTVMTKGA